MFRAFYSNHVDRNEACQYWNGVHLHRRDSGMRHKLRNTCINLEPTRRYRVMGTRGELVHDCPIHEAGVRAVGSIAAFDARKAFPGSKIVFEPMRCDQEDCSMFDMCHPSGEMHHCGGSGRSSGGLSARKRPQAGGVPALDA